MHAAECYNGKDTLHTDDSVRCGGAMAISIELPDDVEMDLRRRLGDLDRSAKEAMLIELFRQRAITHQELSRSLGLSRFETDALLKQHDVMEDITLDDVLRDAEASHGARTR